MDIPRPIQILLVEDSPDHAVFFRAALGKAYTQPHEVDQAVSLAECYAQMANRHYDLVVLDLGLPDSQGLETVERFFREKGPQNPVIVLTANFGSGIGEKALRAGAIDFLTKGEFGADQLARTVRYGLERWRQRMELDEAQRSLKSFAHVAAHDLKSPVKSIGLYSGLLRDLMKQRGAGAEELEYLGFVETFADQAERLVDNLLQFSLLGEKAVSLESVDVEGLARQACQNLSAKVKESGAAIAFSDMPKATADAGLVLHVLQNLIGNAIKYRGESPPRVEVGGVLRGGEVEFSVSDNGRGIDPAHFTRIFAPFKRLNGTADEEGVGLGLAICQRVIDAHHGRIWVESKLGSGSTFRFTLPLSSDVCPQQEISANEVASAFH